MVINIIASLSASLGMTVPSVSGLAPKLLKGALIGMDVNNPLASVITFQFNPEKLTRTLTPQFGAQGGSPAESLRLRGAPRETVQVDIELDAAELLEKGDALAQQYGLHPQLAALEMLVYPKTAYVRENLKRLKAGEVEIVPPLAPVSLFIWGKLRVLPTRISAFSITEEFFDTRLNPVHAKVTLSLQVLNYNDLPPDHPAFEMFMAHQTQKELVATMGSMSQAAGSAINLITTTLR